MAGGGGSDEQPLQQRLSMIQGSSQPLTARSATGQDTCGRMLFPSLMQEGLCEIAFLPCLPLLTASILLPISLLPSVPASIPQQYHTTHVRTTTRFPPLAAAAVPVRYLGYSGWVVVRTRKRRGERFYALLLALLSISSAHVCVYSWVNSVCNCSIGHIIIRQAIEFLYIVKYRVICDKFHSGRSHSRSRYLVLSAPAW